MLPTLSHTGDFVVVSPLAYTRLFSSTRRPVRGDLVFATSPTDPRTTLCKRVVGLEGDIVEVEPRRPVERVDEAEKRSGNRHGIKSWGDGMETGYGAEVEEIHGQHGQEAIVRNDDHGMPPLPAPTWSRRKEGQFVRVPKGHVWLAGDNMSNSTDSRMYGPVPLALIKGKVIGRVRDLSSGSAAAGGS
jgi:inner membrane protease subunit 1